MWSQPTEQLAAQQGLMGKLWVLFALTYLWPLKKRGLAEMSYQNFVHCFTPWRLWASAGPTAEVLAWRLKPW